jgi:hypothetical protein
MVTIRDGQQSFSSICFSSLVGWTQPNGGYCDVKCQGMTDIGLRKDIPESIAVIVRISLLHLNSGLTINIFAIYQLGKFRNITRKVEKTRLGIKRKFSHETSEWGQVAVIIKSSEEVQ